MSFEGEVAVPLSVDRSVAGKIVTDGERIRQRDISVVVGRLAGVKAEVRWGALATVAKEAGTGVL